MFAQMMDHINSLNLINENHHGGIAKHSTTTCVLQFLDNARTALEAKKKTAIMAIDLSSAYDLVNHHLLLEKCRLMSEGPVCLSWLKSFLEHRKQFVEIGGVRSKERQCGPEGVVQGGPSSGELFVIFMNSLPINLKKVAHKDRVVDAESNEFVDDLNSVVSGNTEDGLVANIKIEFERIQNHLVEHRMKINANKTQLMFISPSLTLQTTPITIDQSVIYHQEHIKILGITLSSNFKFDQHLRNGQTNMIKSLNAKTAMLRSIRKHIPIKPLAIVANNLINSTILYGAPIWAATSLANIAAVQKGQVKAAKMVLGVNWEKGIKTHRQTLLNKLNWPNVNQILEAASMNMVKRAITGNSSTAVNEMFKIKNKRHPRGEPQITLNHSGPINRSDSNFSAKATNSFNKLPAKINN